MLFLYDSCTRFDNLGRDKHVLRRVYIDKLISWKTVPAFFDRCIDAENLNALFIKGLVRTSIDLSIHLSSILIFRMHFIFRSFGWMQNECFNYRRFESGIHYFLKASEKGSRKSSYVLGMIYFSADFSRCDGIRLLRKITDGRKDGWFDVNWKNEFESQVHFKKNLDQSQACRPSELHKMQKIQMLAKNNNNRWLESQQLRVKNKWFLLWVLYVESLS